MDELVKNISKNKTKGIFGTHIIRTEPFFVVVHKQEKYTEDTHTRHNERID